MTATTTSSASDSRPSHDDYHLLLEAIRANFAAVGTEPLFTTDAADLWPLFLDGLPTEERQPHTCNACRHFVERFGGLVTISSDGHATSALFTLDNPLGIYRRSLAKMCDRIASARVTGVFLSSLPAWGVLAAFAERVDRT